MTFSQALAEIELRTRLRAARNHVEMLRGPLDTGHAERIAALIRDLDAAAEIAEELRAAR